MSNQMDALMYRCPTTSHHVKTAIDTEPARLARMRNIKISVSCPHCIEGHSIPANEIFGRLRTPTLLSVDGFIQFTLMLDVVGPVVRYVNHVVCQPFNLKSFCERVLLPEVRSLS